MAHRLDPLLRPDSIAVVGASERPGTVGNQTLGNLLAGRFAGDIYPVNPGYKSLQGLQCFKSVSDLPAPPDLAIFCISDNLLEAALDSAIDAGIRAVSLMSPLVIDEDHSPPLRERVHSRIASAGIVACGANGMGFYNVRGAVWACGFDGRRHQPPGSVALISQSGSGMCGIVDCDERIRFSLAVSTGNEISVTMDEYIDFALELPETKVIGLFVETARKPQQLRAALEKANSKRIPVVAIKVGRTDRSAALAVSHSGALAGDDATYDALFDRYGVQRVSDMDELATALILLSEWPLPAEGGLVSLHDSGGERQLLVDLADAHGVPLPDLSPATVAALEKILDPELPAVNPLDGWSRGGPDYDTQMTNCLSLLLRDESAAAGVLMHDRAPYGRVYPQYLDYMRRANRESGKPVALVAARQGTGSDARVTEATHAGFPVLDGVSNFLVAVRAMFAWRDFLHAPADTAPEVDPATAGRWRKRLQSAAGLSEADALAMLADFGISACRSVVAESEHAVLNAADEIGYPVVLKTATAGIAHKSDVCGVVLNLQDPRELSDAYRVMSAALGPAVIVAAMCRPGVEMILGSRRDSQFGPVVVLGFGGIHAEALRDVVVALPPFGERRARELVDRLRMRSLLDASRGSPPAAVDDFCAIAAKFSAMVYAMGNLIDELDVNPVLLNCDAAIAVDALLIRGAIQRGNEQ